MNAVASRNAHLKLLLISALVFIADRLSKLWIIAHIPSGQDITIILRFFRLTHVYNNGAAFSLFADTPSPDKVRLMLIAFSAIAIVIVLAVFWKAGRVINTTSIALAMSSAARWEISMTGWPIATSSTFPGLQHLRLGHYPDFNVADSCIVIGACLLLLEVFRAPKSLFTD